MAVNSFQATQLLRDELASALDLGLYEEGNSLIWGYGDREYLVSLVLFDVTKEEV